MSDEKINYYNTPLDKIMSKYGIKNIQLDKAIKKVCEESSDKLTEFFAMEKWMIAPIPYQTINNWRTGGINIKFAQFKTITLVKLGIEKAIEEITRKKVIISYEELMGSDKLYQ